MDDASENELTAELLRSVLPSPRWDTLDFLNWVYDENPLGPVLAQNYDRDGTRVCHIGGVPLQMRSRDDEGRFVIYFNSSTAAGEQGKGTYVKALFKIHERGRALGHYGAFGVTNAASTGPAVKGFHARHMGALPAKLCVPTTLRSPGYEHHEVTPELLASPRFVELTEDLDTFPATGWTQDWTTDVLRWRLAWPGCHYWIHVGPDLFAVTTRTDFKHVPLAVLLKVLPRHGRGGPIASDQLIAAIAKHHRVPGVIYAGFNANVPVKGFRLPQERLPSPLNLLFLSNPDLVDTDTFTFDTFEFLDFDAY